MTNQRFETGSGTTIVHASVIREGKDLIVTFGGGTHPHIGAVAVGVPRPSLADPTEPSASVSVICLTGHKEDTIARKAAHHLTTEFNCHTAVTVGLHIDNASEDEIAQLVHNFYATLEDVTNFIRKETLSTRSSWTVDDELITVDAEGTTTGTISRRYAHDGDGILHRAFSVLLVNDEGNVMLCRRSDEKRLFAGVLSDTCAGHPVPGEDTREAAEARLVEELGFTTALAEVGAFIYQESFQDAGSENEYCHLFVGTIPTDTRIHLNPHEESEVVWMTPDELRAQLKKPTEPLAPWLVTGLLETDVLTELDKLIAG